jgi:hypothetical protein
MPINPKAIELLKSMTPEEQDQAFQLHTPEEQQEIIDYLKKPSSKSTYSPENTIMNIGGLNFPVSNKMTQEIKDAGKKVVNELAMGGGGEIVGSIAKLGGGSYSKARDEFDKDVKDFEEAHPTLSPALTGASIAGQVAATGGAGALGQVTKIGVKQALKQAMKSGAKIGTIAGALGGPNVIKEEGIDKEKIVPAITNTLTGTLVGTGLGGVLGTVPEAAKYLGKSEIVQGLMSGVYKKTIGKLKTIFGPNWKEKTVEPLLTELKEQGQGRVKSIPKLEEFVNERANVYNDELNNIVSQGTKEGLGIQGKEIIDAAETKLKEYAHVSDVKEALQKEIDKFKEHVSTADELKQTIYNQIERGVPLTRIENKTKPYDYMSLNDIRHQKTTYGEELYKGKLTSSDANAAKAKQVMREIMDDAMYKAAKEGVDPKFAEKIAYLNNKENVMLNNAKLLSKSGEQKVGVMEMLTNVSPATLGGALGFMFGGGAGVVGGVGAGVALKKYGPQIASKLAEKSGTMVGPTRKAAKFLTIGGSRQTTKKD